MHVTVIIHHHARTGLLYSSTILRQLRLFSNETTVPQQLQLSFDLTRGLAADTSGRRLRARRAQPRKSQLQYARAHSLAKQGGGHLSNMHAPGLCSRARSKVSLLCLHRAEPS
jgi:hypothetical protein